MKNKIFIYQRLNTRKNNLLGFQTKFDNFSGTQNIFNSKDFIVGIVGKTNRIVIIINITLIY